VTGPLTGWRRVPLTARLAVIIALAIAATVAVMGINAVSYLRENLMTGAKESALLASQAMQGDAGSARSLTDFRSADGSASPSEPKIDLQPRPGGFYVVVSSEDGRRDRISQYRLPSPDGADLGGEAIELTDAQVDQLDASPVLGSRPVRLEIEGLGEFLVTASPLTSTGLQTWGTLYTGSSLAPTDAAISDFVGRDILLYTALGAVVVCLAVVVVARSLRPLRQIASVADRIAATPLAEGEVAIPQRAPAPDPRSRSEADRLAASFNRMLENVETSLQARERTDRSMKRFVAEASHELRNPVAAIRGYAEYAGAAPGLPSVAATSLERIEAESTRLGALVDQLLLLARVDAGREVGVQPVDLTLIVLEVVQDCRVRWPGHSWLVDLPGEPVRVMGSEDALRRILINLTSNAGAHTPSGTIVRVALRCGDEGGGLAMRWALSVTDDGPGIAEGDLPTVFDRFTQASGGRESVRDSGGTGLGLAIVRALAQESGYGVRADSRPGRTCFTVSDLSGA
jgi:two-component system OmpR family sensor kinase